MLTFPNISSLPNDSCTCVFNPRRMREGYGSHSVCVRVCVSVTTLAAIPVCMSKVRHRRVP